MSEKRYICPVCSKPVPRKAPDFPFCSDRCQRIDLGRWATGEYRIPGEPMHSLPGDDDDDT